MKDYYKLLEEILESGERVKNGRTGEDVRRVFGRRLEFDMADGYPLLTGRFVPWKVIINEMLGFMRGFTSAAQFRELGVNVWNANANETKSWLDNPLREGEDDLGRIYGAQARSWTRFVWDPATNGIVTEVTDQLYKVYDHLRQGIDDRREIVSHWNPGELHMMALAPCHLLVQWGLSNFGEGPLSWHDRYTGEVRLGGDLDLQVYIRSSDVPLGLPFNIAGYAWLLHAMAHITGHNARRLIVVTGDTHVYENQVEPVYEMLNHVWRNGASALPQLEVKEGVTWEKLTESKLQAEDMFQVHDYQPGPKLSIPMAP